MTHADGQKIWRQKRQGLLRPLPVPSRPWAGLSVDFMMGLPPSDTATRKACETLMVITCRLTGAVILRPLNDSTAATVADEFLHEVFAHHGLPEYIISDRGPQFVSMLWARLCECLKIERKLSTAYHPQTDGSTERANQEVQAYLRIHVAFT